MGAEVGDEFADQRGDQQAGGFGPAAGSADVDGDRIGVAGMDNIHRVRRRGGNPEAVGRRDEPVAGFGAHDHRRARRPGDQVVGMLMEGHALTSVEPALLDVEQRKPFDRNRFRREIGMRPLAPHPAPRSAVSRSWSATRRRPATSALTGKGDTIWLTPPSTPGLAAPPARPMVSVGDYAAARWHGAVTAGFNPSRTAPAAVS